MNEIGATLLALAAAAAAPAADAADLPPATSLAECATTVGNIDDPVGCQTQTDLAEVTLAPFAGTHAEATYPGGFDLANAGAIAQLSYSWVFEGGAPGDLLPVEIAVNLGVSSFGSSNALGFASVTAQSPLQGNVQACVSTNGLCPLGGQGFNGTITIMTRSGDVNTIVIEAEASGAFSADVNGGSAFADPHIFLDPAFPAGADYRLRISDGIGNEVSPVPQTGTAALAAAGLAVLAGALRRRRRVELGRAATAVGVSR